MEDKKNQKAREFLAEKLKMKIPIKPQKIVMDEFLFNDLATIMEIYKMDGIMEYLKNEIK